MFADDEEHTDLDGGMQPAEFIQDHGDLKADSLGSESEHEGGSLPDQEPLAEIAEIATQAASTPPETSETHSAENTNHAVTLPTPLTPGVPTFRLPRPWLEELNSNNHGENQLSNAGPQEPFLVAHEQQATELLSQKHNSHAEETKPGFAVQATKPQPPSAQKPSLCGTSNSDPLPFESSHLARLRSRRHWTMQSF